uniref:Divinyl chlorophyllide a 8-vinyl-reductase, chloroplastic n=1 Tax=Fibrocapsa japonica TaxID=94617 RepID=A0A7S2Y0I1_9STRA|mmetsp:Transcript_8395/g.12801  ORF Transcript_8395/g.12801 Transcript_8395/m.12801 type:complete len:390 (+) Transcript_8395:251-1420(+)
MGHHYSLMSLAKTWLLYSSLAALLVQGYKTCNSVLIAGATGYVGRAVTQELVSRGIPTIALVRNANTISGITSRYLRGAEIVECNVMDQNQVIQCYNSHKPAATICCLASRNGLGKDSFAVDYGASMNLLTAVDREHHFALLSAFCVGKPKLQFQFAKLKLEAAIQQAQAAGELGSYAITRPTAYFKSLDGQIESAKSGGPVLYFGDGKCSANPICETDLAKFIVDSAIAPAECGMLNAIRNVGGPDVPPITKLEQIELIYDTLNTPAAARRAISIPLGVLDFLIDLVSSLKGLISILSVNSFAEKFEDITEIIRIIKYYASEPMVAVDKERGEVQGSTQLADHFARLAKKGGALDERDQFTTTTGVLDLVIRNNYETYRAESLDKQEV